MKNEYESFISKGKKRIDKAKEIPETDIEKHYCEYAKKKGCLALKLVVLRKRGFPDRTTLCTGARILFVEFKKKGEDLSPIQKLVRKVLVSFSFKYIVADEIGIAEKALDEFLKSSYE
jgi:hypothetical protein